MRHGLWDAEREKAYLNGELREEWAPAKVPSLFSTLIASRPPWDTQLCHMLLPWHSAFLQAPSYRPKRPGTEMTYAGDNLEISFFKLFFLGISSQWQKTDLHSASYDQILSNLIARNKINRRSRFAAFDDFYGVNIFTMMALSPQYLHIPCHLCITESYGML